MDCIYGGISFIEKTENTDSELNSFCTPHNGGLSHSRRIISKMATLIILTFWYKHYSQTSVSISLISTKCRAIQIDICKFHLSCLYNSRQSRCLEYIRPIFRAANVKFEYQNVQTFSNKVSQVSFLPQLNQCIIFQYTQNLKFNTIYENSDADKYLSHCRLRLRVASIAKPGLKVNYIFLGSSKHRENDKKWYINFKGLNDKFCYRLGIRGKLYCQSQICTKERCFSRANQFIPHELVSFFKVTSKTDTEFQIIANTASPTFDLSFYFQMKLARWTQTWIDVVVWITTSVATSQIVYLSESIPIELRKHRVKFISRKPNTLLFLHFKSSSKNKNSYMVVKYII